MRVQTALDVCRLGQAYRKARCEPLEGSCRGGYSQLKRDAGHRKGAQRTKQQQVEQATSGRCLVTFSPSVAAVMCDGPRRRQHMPNRRACCSTGYPPTPTPSTPSRLFHQHGDTGGKLGRATASKKVTPSSACVCVQALPCFGIYPDFFGLEQNIRMPTCPAAVSEGAKGLPPPPPPAPVLVREDPLRLEEAPAAAAPAAAPPPPPPLLLGGRAGAATTGLLRGGASGLRKGLNSSSLSSRVAVAIVGVKLSSGTPLGYTRRADKGD